MNRIKRILSMVLVCVMALAIIPVVPTEVSAAATGTTALFNGNATYLLQERFASPHVLDGDATRVLSGWDIDYRGGDVTLDGSIEHNNGALITDSNAYEKVTMNHKLMKHTGALVMESVFTFKTPVDEGFYYEMAGNGSTALRIKTERITAGGASCRFEVNGVDTAITVQQNVAYHLKAEFTGSTVTVWINGEKVADNVAYLESTSSLDEIEIGTSETGIGKIQIKNVYVYVNYTVNESFLGSKAVGWNAANGEVVEVPGAPYAADTKGFSLSATEAVEPSYVSDDARVRIVADKASEFNWTGSDAVVVTDNHTIGGRSGVVMATGLGNGNGTTVGVVLGDNFAFKSGDVLTYSFDVYSTTAGNANVWLRSHGSSLNPFATLYHSVAANTWTTVTKTLTFDELEALISTSNSSGSFTTASKYALYIRPTVSTLYLDNFKVTVMSEDGEYYSNVATGEWLKMNETMDGQSNNVLVGSNMTSSYADGVLSSTYTSGDSNNSIVAVKVVDANGIPVTTIPAGSVIDVTVDVHSTNALNTTTGTAGIMLRGGTMTNGGSGPSATNIYQLGKLTASANTWTTQKASYTVASDLTVSGAWFIFLRPQQTGTLKVDNFKISIKDPEASIMAPTWEINSAADVTWKNGGTATDANGIGGRDGVVALGNLANSNSNTAGIVLGTSFAFKEGDVLKYSFDAYSTAAIEPDLWLRNHGTSLSPYKQIDIAAIPASTWTTRTGEVDYATLIAAGAFNTADKFALYFRPNTSGTIYIDNFKVEVFNTNQHVVDLVDGARVKFTANSASDLTFANGLASDDATKGAIQMNLNGSGDGTSVGFNMGAGFSFKEGDTFTYSFDIYTETADVYPDLWLRERGSYLAMKTFYNTALTTGTWTTVTGTATYDQLIAEDADYATASNNWYAYIRLRNSKSATVWVKNFTVAVTRPEYAFGELPSNASLEKRFSALSGAQTFSFDVFVPSTGANGFSAKFGGAIFKIANDKFYLGDTEVYTPSKNVWYRIKIVNDGSTAGLYVNGDLKGNGSVSGEMTSISFENTTGTQILVDNIQVAPLFDPDDFSDYPTLSDSDIATPSGDLSLGIASYPMWREGIHYGWDLITPYENRVPYLGYYTGGSQEVADWNIKWWAEHGFDHVIYPFVRPNINAAGGTPQFSVRGEELHDGFMNARYNDKMDFAIMLTNPLAEQFTDAEGNITNAQEWIDNVLPFITEHYFKNPNYKVLDNQLVVYNYNLDGFRDLLTVVDEETGTTTQDGTTEVISILTALNNKAIELGYDGIMFVMDRTSMDEEDLEALTEAISTNSAVKTCYKWRYTWNSDVVTNITTGIANDYANNTNTVASIPMGFENIPWQYNEIGLLEPSEIETICNTVVSQRGSEDPKLVLFTCWDEWGEGHFFSPSSKSGFDYLNAARRTLTDKAADLSGEDQPSTDAIKRMGVLYPEGRQILKIRQDKKDPIDPSIFTTELGTLTPTRSNYVDRAGCTIGGSWISRDYTTYNVTSASQAAVWFDSPLSSEELSKVTAIKVVGYAQNSASLVVKYGSSEDGDNAFGDETGDNRFRFSCANPNPEGTTTGEYILLPNNPTKIAEAANENIDYIRFNTQQNTSDGGAFHIEKIVFYTDEVPNQGVVVNVNEAPLTLTSLSIQGTSGTEMLPAYKILLDIGAKVTWDKSQKILYATKNGVTAEYQNGFRNVVDASDNILATAASGAPHTYQDGNLFVDYAALLKPFGYTVEVDDSGAINYFSPEYFETYDETDYKWEFEKDGDTEGWTLSAGTTPPTTYLQAGSAITVRDGVMHYRASHTDTHVLIDGLSMPKASAKYFTINLDTNATQMLLRLYDAGTYNTAGGLVYVVSIPEVDGPQEIVVDFSTATPRDSGASFDALADTITKVRLDAIYGKTGSNYIDSIEFSSSLAPFQFKAFSFGDNLLDYSAAYWTYSGMLDKNGVTTGGWGASPTVVTDGEYTNVLQFKPNEGHTHGFAGITWLKSGAGVGELETAVAGNQVRVSFDYKAVGDAYQLRFENRDTVNGRDGEEFILPATSEWQHFDGFVNMDEVESSGRRTYAIRAFRNSTSGDGAILIKDWQIRVLDESTEVNMFTDSGVAIKVINNDDVTSTTKVFVSAFDAVNRELNGFSTGSIPNTVTVANNDSTKTETYPYYYMAPTDATTEIRTYIWDNFEPLTEPFVLQKAN